MSGGFRRVGVGLAGGSGAGAETVDGSDGARGGGVHVGALAGAPVAKKAPELGPRYAAGAAGEPERRALGAGAGAGPCAAAVTIDGSGGARGGGAHEGAIAGVPDSKNAPEFGPRYEVGADGDSERRAGGAGGTRCAGGGGGAVVGNEDMRALAAYPVSDCKRVKPSAACCAAQFLSNQQRNWNLKQRLAIGVPSVVRVPTVVK